MHTTMHTRRVSETADRLPNLGQVDDLGDRLPLLVGRDRRVVVVLHRLGRMSGDGSVTMSFSSAARARSWNVRRIATKRERGSGRQAVHRSEVGRL